MALTELLSTSRVSAEATVERLQALGIDAQTLDVPNVFVRATSGGNYRVRVVVPEEGLERARAELARWELEATPRVKALAREVGLSLALTLVPCSLVILYLVTHDPVPSWGPIAVFASLFGSIGLWVLWSRSRKSVKARAPLHDAGG